MQMLAIDRQSPYFKQVSALYERSFPSNERRPIDDLMTVFGSAHEMLVFLHEGCFAGFVSLLTLRDLTHILYLAIEEDFRSQGLGAEALSLIRAHKPAARILADLEDDDPLAPNNAQRLRRMAFYRRSGYCASDVRYRWRGENYVIYISGGTLTHEEFDAFWQHF